MKFHLELLLIFLKLIMVPSSMTSAMLTIANRLLTFGAQKQNFDFSVRNFVVFCLHSVTEVIERGKKNYVQQVGAGLYLFNEESSLLLFLIRFLFYDLWFPIP